MSAGLCSQVVVLLQVLAAVILGGLIGLNRELEDKPAGVRTHALVGGSATLLVAVGQLITLDMAASLGEQQINADPTRIIVAVVMGVSFLGAGTIIHRAQAARGITTAASLLAAACVGIAVGLQQWLVSVGMTAIVVGLLEMSKLLHAWLGKSAQD